MSHKACSPPLDGPAKMKDYLAHYCFEPPKWFKRLSLWLLITAAVLTVLVILAIGVLDRAEGERLLSALSPVATMGLLIAGLWQWRGARQEISMDKYYERLEISNQWWKASPSVRSVMSGSTQEFEDPDMTMYVCLEIDNLEYMIEKYRIGYVDDEQACRGLKAFQVRCLHSLEFKSIARRRVHLGDYTPRTTKVVCKVCDEVDNLIEHHRMGEFASGSHPEGQTHLHIAAAAAIHVTPGYPPPAQVEESVGQPANSVVSFSRRSSDKAAGAASAAAGCETVPASGSNIMHSASQSGSDSERPRASDAGGGAEAAAGRQNKAQG